MPVLNARSAESWKSGPKRQEISDRTLRPFKLACAAERREVVRRPVFVRR